MRGRAQPPSVKLFAFDRDSTVDVNPPAGDREAVPLEWVRHLAHETDHEVWAIGNQALVEEAGVPGDDAVRERFERLYGDPFEHLERREAPNLQYWAEAPATEHVPDPDLVSALAEWTETGDRPARHRRVRLVGSLFPDAEERVVVDNRYLDFLEGWTYHLPWEFTERVRAAGGIEAL